MSKLPDAVSKAWEERDDPVILATVDENRIPNIIYVTCVGTYGEERLVIADNYFNKTRYNVLAGGRGSLLFINKSGKAYQVKGTLEYHTDGDIYDSMKKWNPSKHPGHAALAIRIEEAFSGAERLL